MQNDYYFYRIMPYLLIRYIVLYCITINPALQWAGRQSNHIDPVKCFRRNAVTHWTVIKSLNLLLKKIVKFYQD